MCKIRFQTPRTIFKLLILKFYFGPPYPTFGSNYFWTNLLIFTHTHFYEILLKFLYELNSSFFWNWCNPAIPAPTKSSNPTICSWGCSFQAYLTHSQEFLPFQALSTLPKPLKEGIQKITFLHTFFLIFAIGTSHGPYKHPHVKGYLSKCWKSLEPGRSILGIFTQNAPNLSVSTKTAVNVKVSYISRENANKEKTRRHL